MRDFLFLLLMLLFLPACKGRPPPEAHAVVITERKVNEAEGWDYVATVGIPRGTVDAREVRHSGADGRLHVIAPGEHLPGSEQLEDVERTFQEAGYQFREVKIMIKGGDEGYGIVFRRKG